MQGGFMAEIAEKILKYKDEKGYDSGKCAKKLGLDIEVINKIGNAEEVEFTSEEITRINDTINGKAKSKKIIKSLDLIFRLAAMIMALVTLMLCINENVDSKVLIVLLSIGLVCSSMTILPKIEK